MSRFFKDCRCLVAHMCNSNRFLLNNACFPAGFWFKSKLGAFLSRDCMCVLVCDMYRVAKKWIILLLGTEGVSTGPSKAC